MSEFKFACPVCGQHITADSSNSGGQISCPTCFQKIIVPQAPANPDSKLILSAAQVGKPRPVASNGEQLAAQHIDHRKSVIATIALILVVAAAGGATFAFRDKIFKSSREPTNGAGKKAVTAAPPTIYPIPTNINWTMELSEASIPEAIAAGSIHSKGFFCERATLQGGNLTLRQGHAWPVDLGVTVQLFAKAGEELSGKTVEIKPDRAPPIPKIVLRWKDEQLKPVTRNIERGYALKVAFGDAAGGRIPGKIYISLPDENKSFVAGTFNAEIRKPAAPKQKQPVTQKQAPKPPG